MVFTLLLALPTQGRRKVSKFRGKGGHSASTDTVYEVGHYGDVNQAIRPEVQTFSPETNFGAFFYILKTQ